MTGKIICSAIIAFILICAGIFWHAERADGRQWQLTQAAEKGDLALVKQLYAAGADLDMTPGDQNVSGEPALVTAALEGHDSVVLFFLDHGAGINITDSAHNTALNAAAARGHLSTVQLLLSRGADPNFRGESSPLQSAEGRNDSQMIGLLKAHGARE